MNKKCWHIKAGTGNSAWKMGIQKQKPNTMHEKSITTVGRYGMKKRRKQETKHGREKFGF